MIITQCTTDGSRIEQWLGSSVSCDQESNNDQVKPREKLWNTFTLPLYFLNSHKVGLCSNAAITLLPLRLTRGRTISIKRITQRWCPHETDKSKGWVDNSTTTRKTMDNTCMGYAIQLFELELPRVAPPMAPILRKVSAAWSIGPSRPITLSHGI